MIERKENTDNFSESQPITDDVDLDMEREKEIEELLAEAEEWGNDAFEAIDDPECKANI